MDHTSWVYIVASTTGTLYVGMTNKHRVWEHKTGQFEGSSSKYHCFSGHSMQSLGKSSLRAGPAEENRVD